MGLGAEEMRVWLPQGAAIWFVSLPIQVSAVAGDGLDAVVGRGSSWRVSGERSAGRVVYESSK